MMLTRSTPLKKVLELAPPCKCSACSHGCTMGSGFLVESDIPKIAKFLNVSEEELKKQHLERVELFNKTMWRPKLERKNKPYGKCTFYGEKEGCKIHKVKPLQCKVSMGCKEHGEELNVWFVLNHIVNEHDPESIRQYAQYIEAGGKTIPGGTLKELVPNKKLLKKILEYKILK